MSTILLTITVGKMLSTESTMTDAILAAFLCALVAAQEINASRKAKDDLRDELKSQREYVDEQLKLLRDASDKNKLEVSDIKSYVSAVKTGSGMGIRGMASTTLPNKDTIKF